VNRIAAFVGLLLVLIGLGLFLWKAVVLELPLAATDAEGLWRVELEITLRGTGRRGASRRRCRAPAAPRSSSTNARRRIACSSRSAARTAIASASGAVDSPGVHQVVHGFRVQLSSSTPLPSRITRQPSRELRARWAESTRELPSGAPE
jgi:hypothetical protein